ncbi:MAG TPA: DUF5343 domain-containing protein [bacterium]|jgi:hypothetical protein
MSLPDSYSQKPAAIPAYFDAILDAQPPDRFTIKFLENLGFTSTNDRLFIGILKDLDFLSADGVPTQRYYDFMDRSQAKTALAQAIKDAYTDLFNVNKKANDLPTTDIKNKLRTLFAGKKTNNVIDRIAKTFTALCEYADFSEVKPQTGKEEGEPSKKPAKDKETEPLSKERVLEPQNSSITLESLQYHINIVLPESRDQAVYDAIFRSLREHLGARRG